MITTIVLLAFNASAIVGKIGNARMILNLEQGDSLDKSILVINDNNLSLQIDLVAVGDNASIINIKDSNFVLNPGEQKNAGFTINAPSSSGRYENRINVKFTPIGSNETGVGLSSQVILNVYDKGTYNPSNGSNGSILDNFNSTVLVLLGITIVLVVVAFILLYLAKKKKGEKGGGFENLKLNGKKI